MKEEELTTEKIFQKDPYSLSETMPILLIKRRRINNRENLPERSLFPERDHANSPYKRK